MGLIHRTLVVTCLLLVVTSPVAGAATSVSTGTEDGENASAGAGGLLGGVVGTVGTVGNATTDTLEETTTTDGENASSGTLTDATGTVLSDTSEGVGRVTTSVGNATTGTLETASGGAVDGGSPNDAVETTTDDARSENGPDESADGPSDVATDGPSDEATDGGLLAAADGRAESTRVLDADSRVTTAVTGNATVTDPGGILALLDGTNDGLRGASNAVLRSVAERGVENATLELVRAPENRTTPMGPEVVAVGGSEPIERLGLNASDRSILGPNASGPFGGAVLLGDDAPIGDVVPIGTERDALVRPELPRLALTESALVLEVRTVDAGGLSTVTVPLDPVDTWRSPPDEGTSGDAVDAGTPGGPDDEPARAERTATPTPTPGEENVSVAAGGSPGGGEPTTEDGLFGLNLGSAFEFVPPLGAALFVLVARPWVGVLSGAASIASSWLGRIGVLLRYGRHDGSDPLEHETRSRLHDLVSETPGQTLTQLSAELDTPLSTIRHHVRVLERERVIVTKKQRGNRRIYPLGAENAELAAALQEDSSAAIIATLHEQGRATVGDVVDRVEKSYGTVSYHLSRLVDEGLVCQERDGRKKVSRLDPDVESLLESPEDPTPVDVDRPGTEASAD